LKKVDKLMLLNSHTRPKYGITKDYMAKIDEAPSIGLHNSLTYRKCFYKAAGGDVGTSDILLAGASPASMGIGWKIIGRASGRSGLQTRMGNIIKLSKHSQHTIRQAKDRPRKASKPKGESQNSLKTPHVRETGSG